MTILLDLPGGRRELRDIPDETARRRELRIPQFNPVRLTLKEPDPSELTRGVKVLTARPTGDWDVKITDDGVSAVEIWRAE